MKAQNRLKNLRRQYERLLSACDLYKWAAERRVARSQLREHTIRDIESIRTELDRILGLVHELPKLPPEEPLERALYGLSGRSKLSSGRSMSESRASRSFRPMIGRMRFSRIAMLGAKHPTRKDSHHEPAPKGKAGKVRLEIVRQGPYTPQKSRSRSRRLACHETQRCARPLAGDERGCRRHAGCAGGG